MEPATLFFLVVGAPLILVGLGFALLCLRWLLTSRRRDDQARLLELAVKIDADLSRLETRLAALEDILMTPEEARAARSRPAEL
ncbi:MAG: hypothetical protein LBU12_02625 [Deltaproteobacteria bacterium]|jgi:hypothetical protein|nr:hypothetical protein [Deltaproteobacteria bacterium]